jgi:hypothetical protein
MSNDDLMSVAHLSRDLRAAAATLSDDEARYLADAYYIMQEDRKRTKAQERAHNAAAEPSAVLSWLANQSSTLEKQITVALDRYTNAHVMGSWMRGVYGIGPVLSAGLLAHLSAQMPETVGHWWQFAGIAGDDQRPWVKGQKRPHNAKLKTLCWKIGESFVKMSGDERCFYGRLWRERKDLETQRNTAGAFAAQAAKALPHYRATTEAHGHYATGHLPPAHIHARARRYAVKIFLSHLHAEWYRTVNGREPPKPFAIAILGHAHEIKPVGKSGS